MIIGILMVLIMVIVGIISSNKEKKIISENHNLDNADLKTLKKFFNASLGQGDLQLAVNALLKINENNPSEYLCKSYIGPLYYFLKNYNQAEIYLEPSFTKYKNLPIKERKKQRDKNDLGEYEAIGQILMYGQVKYLQKDYAKAKEAKEIVSTISKIYDKIVYTDNPLSFKDNVTPDGKVNFTAPTKILGITIK